MWSLACPGISRTIVTAADGHAGGEITEEDEGIRVETKLDDLDVIFTH